MIRQVITTQLILPILFGVLFFIGLCCTPHSTLAATFEGGPVGGWTIPPSGDAFGITYDSPVTSDPSGGGGGGGGGGVAAVAETQPADQPVIVDFANPLYQWLYEFVYAVFTTLFSFAGALMTFGINNFLLGFGNIYYNLGVGFAVEEVWRIIRDLFNLTFIFGLVYIGFKMILDSSDSRARSMLVSLIGAALLVNFSLFITKFIIDLSHVAASVVADGFGTARNEIANAFINILNLETTLQISQQQINGFSDGGALAYIFGLMIFLSVATFVFAAGGILLIIRFIALNVYMVFSPVMFLGWVFPAFSGTSSKFWKGFLRQAFFAPAYLLMLYLSFKVLYAYGVRPGAESYAAMFSTDQATRVSALEALPFFVMAMVFLIMSLTVARSMGAVGASTAISVGNNLQRNVRGSMTRAATYVPRATGRVVVNKAGEVTEKKLNTLQARGGIVGWAASRNSVDRTVRGTAQSAAKARFGTSGSNKEQREYAEGISSRTSQTRAKAENEMVIAAGLAALTQAPGSRDEEAIRKMQVAVASMGISQLEAMSDKARTSIAGELTSSQTEALMKSDKLGSDDKAAISTARKEAVKKIAGDTGAIMSEEFTKLTVDQLETMGAEYIQNNAHLLTTTQVDEVKKSKKFTEAQKNQFTAARGKKFEDAFAGSTNPNQPTQEVRDIFKHSSGKMRKPADIAALGRDVLLKDASIQFLTPDILESIAVKKTLGTSDRAELKKKIMSGPRSGVNGQLQGWLMSPEGVDVWK